MFFMFDFTGAPGNTKRTARAAEAQARILREQSQMLYDAMTPEAKERIAEAREEVLLKLALSSERRKPSSEPCCSSARSSSF
jgi:hypothetical protein